MIDVQIERVLYPLGRVLYQLGRVLYPLGRVLYPMGRWKSTRFTFGVKGSESQPDEEQIHRQLSTEIDLQIPQENKAFQKLKIWTQYKRNLLYITAIVALNRQHRLYWRWHHYLTHSPRFPSTWHHRHESFHNVYCLTGIITCMKRGHEKRKKDYK